MIGNFAKVAIAVAGMATAMLPLAAEAQARPHWGGGRHWRGDRGIDGGDVLAGLLIIGGIAAIASAASKSKNRTTAPDRLPDDQAYRGDPVQTAPDRDDDWRSDGGQGSFGQQSTRSINDAVERCVDEASQRGEVEEVYDASRNGAGYRVAGTLRGGEEFSCEISGQGGVRIDVQRGRP